MIAAMCIIGLIVDDLATYSLDECLILLPMMHLFHIIADDLIGFEGWYVYYNRKKNKWIRSDKTSGEGKETCFVAPGKKHEHEQNASSKEEMRQHPFLEVPTKRC